ncbi:MAG: hypothetical protein P8Z30_18545 [Acidobacteriota bacterium]
MLKSMKTGGRAWTRSLSVLARSPIYVIALAAVAGLWCLAGYEWLWLPESSGWVLALTFVWILALAAIALAVLAGSVASVSSAAAGTDRRLRLRRILCFEKKRLGRTFVVVLAGLLLFFVLGAMFGWLNSHALAVASFLTFHLQHPVSYVPISNILWVIEALVWIVFAGFVMTWLLVFSNPPRPASTRNTSKMLAGSISLSVFLTGLLSAVVFGGLAWLLATWHPVVKAGGWDYAQLVVRNGAALLLLTLGWLFWGLALARLMEPAELPPRS